MNSLSVNVPVVATVSPSEFAEALASASSSEQAFYLNVFFNRLFVACERDTLLFETQLDRIMESLSDGTITALRALGRYPRRPERAGGPG